MPRPKRTRIAATRAAAAPAAAPVEPQQSSATPPITTESTTAQARLPSSDIYDVSDREKERRNRRIAEAAKGDAPQTRRTRASHHQDLNSEQTKAIEESRLRRDDAMQRLDDLTSTPRPDQEESPTAEQRGREFQPRLTDFSGLDLDDSFGNLDDSLDITENTTEDTQGGHRSTDTSSFNMAMFRRRPRQSSVAGRDDAPIRPSSRGRTTPSVSTALNFGIFKRRAREPSIIGTTRKPRGQRSQSQTSQASRAGSVLDDDSGPDDESTPLDKTRRQTRASPAARSSEDLPVSPTRKRKSLESHEDGREKRVAAEVAGEDEIHESIEVDNDAPAPTPPRGRALNRERFSTPVQEDDPDMAPPLSSSASEGGSPVVWPSIDTLAHRTYTRKPPPRAQRTPELDNDASDVSSPPSLTHSPNYSAAAAKAAAKKKAAAAQKKVTTADLTSLLPRRRHKASKRNTDNNDPFDLDDSDDGRYDISAVGQSEDELSYVDSRAARRRRAGQQPLGKSASNRKGKEAGGSKKRSVRTYGAGTEDKENDVVEESIVVGGGDEEVEEEVEEEMQEEAGDADAETSQMMTERIGGELQQAVKKFKEVDKWELSFEEVAERSSPNPDAR